MDRSEVVTLVSKTWVKDDIGQQVASLTRRDVFCNVGSVSLSEWDTAWRAGLKPSFRVTMFSCDYDGEDTAEYKGRVYKVYRTYLGKDDTIELYLEGSI